MSNDLPSRAARGTGSTGPTTADGRADRRPLSLEPDIVLPTDTDTDVTIDATGLSDSSRIHDSAPVIAHDINNYLAVISVATASLARSGHGGSEVSTIEIAVQRAGQLTSQLLESDASKEGEIPVTDVAGHLLAATAWLQRGVSPGVELDLSVSDSPLSVHITPLQLDRLLLNLVSNADDAMPGGGRIKLDARRVHVAPGDRLLPAGEHVCVEITDTGSGIPAESLDLIFEPTYSTKPRHEGSGLGLAACRGIVSQAGGRIAARISHIGTTFTIHLPAAPGGQTPSADEQLDELSEDHAILTDS